jgi:hypothetical protein
MPATSHPVSGHSRVTLANGVLSHNATACPASLQVTDPTFAAPFFANLVDQNEGGFALIWSRPHRRDRDGRGRARPGASARPIRLTS